MAVLRELCASPAFAALVLTEVNPTHDPGGALLGRYVDGVTAALAGPGVGWHGAIGGWAWDLRLYLLCPQPHLMGPGPGRRSFPGTVVRRCAPITQQRRLGAARHRMGKYMDASTGAAPASHQSADFEVARSIAAQGRQEPVMRSFDLEVADNPATSSFESEIGETATWLASSRFEGITRLYSARQVVEQRGTIPTDYTVARLASEQFYDRLRQLFAERKQITTFGPYSPGQAVALKRMGIEGIYLGGWATSARGSVTEDPGPDLASYPLSQVPDEAAPIVRALLTADRNQRFARSRMSEAQRAASPEIDYRPFIIADADTGHGGDAHVRNLIRRFVEVGVPGYHIEDQKPGAKKCGHQAGKVLVGVDEQIKRLSAARFQLDVMKVPGVIVARTDAEAATFLEGRGDERDHPFILGATNVELPTYKMGYLAILRKLHELGIDDARGYLLYQVSAAEYDEASAWLDRTGVTRALEESVTAFRHAGESSADGLLDRVGTRYLEAWQSEANLMSYPQAVADVIGFRASEGERFDMSVDEWLAFANRTSFHAARARAKSMGIDITWDCEAPKTPEGYYQIQSGIEYAIARSLAVAPFADLLWMETKTANLADARRFAEAFHAEDPTKMLAYNLSPSFNWDTTGMSEEEMRRFPEELGKLGFVFNFITYGGHQIDGLAAEEFAAALKQEGMLSLARLQRKFRLVESPYRTPQTLVGGPRLDAALMASSGGTAATKAMGKGSTQHQHLVQTEVPTKLLEEWLEMWTKHHQIPGSLHAALRPHTAGSELLELTLSNTSGEKVASIVFAVIADRRGRNILSVRDQNTFDSALRKKRLMTLNHLFLAHRYKIWAVHYVSPTNDNRYQAQKMKTHGLFSDVHDEVGHIIVADVSADGVKALLAPDRDRLNALIQRKYPYEPVDLATQSR
jgi:isocitrate lyase